jgi:hypothetical protein
MARRVPTLRRYCRWRANRAADEWRRAVHRRQEDIALVAGVKADRECGGCPRTETSLDLRVVTSSAGEESAAGDPLTRLPPRWRGSGWRWSRSSLQLWRAAAVRRNAGVRADRETWQPRRWRCSPAWTSMKRRSGMPHRLTSLARAGRRHAPPSIPCRRQSASTRRARRQAIEHRAEAAGRDHSCPHYRAWPPALQDSLRLIRAAAAAAPTQRCA